MSSKVPKPLRDVEIDFDINNDKCINCKDKPCLESCPINSIYLDSDDGLVKIDENCFGCVLCRNSCPYDAIEIDRKLAEPIRENVPNINKKLCRACGACVQACKSGAIHLRSTGGEEMHSEIDEDKCIRCGYCYRVCPTDSIKYGHILPKAIKEGRTVVINDKECIGCMTCLRVCPSKGAIEVAKTNKLPYINPSYCARCEECLKACPPEAIHYSTREEAYESFNTIRTLEIAHEIIEKDNKRLSKDIPKMDSVLIDLLEELNERYQFEDYDFKNTKNIFDVSKEEEFGKLELFTCTNCKSIVVNITNLLADKLAELFDKNLNIDDVVDIIEFFPPISSINVVEDNCVGCGLCVDVCPTNSIDLEMPAPIKIQDSCIFCGKCAEVCSFEAIRLEEKFFTNRNHEIFFIKRDLRGQRKGTFSVLDYACQLCGVCAKNCPTGALSVDGRIIVDQDKCISCRHCETLCPVNAIKILTVWQFID